MSFEKKRRLRRLPLPAKEALVGKRVTSLAGRDRGRVYTVIAVETDRTGKDFAFLSDGKRRTEARLKRKAFKHVNIIDQN